MRIALIGHGRMGKLIESLAAERGHEIVTTITHSHAGLGAEQLVEALSAADVAIDFSAAEVVRRNVEACVAAGVPIVEGTTGWNDLQTEIKELVTERGGSMVFGANFSIGVNLFYKIADAAAELFAKFSEYEAFIEEQHHSRKNDAPSGTALKLKEIVSRHVEIGEIPSTRAGNIPGTHRLGFDGTADQILIEHTARTREGFAMGAVFAAEWIVGRKGFFEFGEAIDEIVERNGYDD